MKYSKSHDNEVFFMDIVDDLLKDELEEQKGKEYNGDNEIMELERLMEEEIQKMSIEHKPRHDPPDHAP